MKQTTLVIEIVLHEGTSMFLVRDPRNGNVLKILKTPLQVAKFLNEVSEKLPGFDPADK